MTILIAEDNALIAMTLESALSDAGYIVLGSASSVERAVEIATQTPPQLALMNIPPRNGGSGIELARGLKQQ